MAADLRQQTEVKMDAGAAAIGVTFDEEIFGSDSMNSIVASYLNSESVFGPTITATVTAIALPSLRSFSLSAPQARGSGPFPRSSNPSDMASGVLKNLSDEWQSIESVTGPSAPLALEFS